MPTDSHDLLVPTFVIAGAARAGSTALAEKLRAHPQIWMTTPKEPHYLALAGPRPAFTGPGDEVTINTRAVVDEHAYRALFSGAGPQHRMRGDASVSTLYYHEAAAARLHALNPEARIVVSLRDPVDRAYSSHQYLLNRGYETETDFRRALAAEPERIRLGWHHLWHYAGMSHYAASVHHFQQVFGAERVLVTFYDELETAPARVVDRITAFLGVDPVPEDGAEVSRVNASGQPRSRLVASAMQAAGRHRVTRAAVRTVVPFAVRERIRNANLRRSGLDATERAEVRERFAEDQARLAAILDRPLPPSWSA